MAQIQGQTNFDAIAAKPEFTSAPPEVQFDVASRFFDDHYGATPEFKQAPPEVQDDAKQRFFQDYKIQSPAPVTGLTPRQPAQAPQWLQELPDELGYAAATTALPFATAAKAYTMDYPWLDAETPLLNYARGVEKKYPEAFAHDPRAIDSPYSQAGRMVSYGAGALKNFQHIGGLLDKGLQGAGRYLLPRTSRLAIQAGMGSKLDRAALTAVSQLQARGLLPSMGRWAAENALYEGLKSHPENQFDMEKRAQDAAMGAVIGAGGGALLHGAGQVMKPVAHYAGEALEGTGKTLHGGIKVAQELINPSGMWHNVATPNMTKLAKRFADLIDHPGLTDAEAGTALKEARNLVKALEEGRLLNWNKLGKKAKMLESRVKFRTKLKLGQARAKARELYDTIGPTIHINTPKRVALREEWIEKAFETLTANAKPGNKRADIVMGLPASGKSTIADALVENNQSVLIDSDYFKENHIPEFGKGEGATITHEESDLLAQALQTIAIKEKYPLTIPVVGKTLKGLEARINLLRENGYEVYLHYADLPLEKTQERALQRFIKTGRLVDSDYIQSVGLKPLQNFDKLKTDKAISGYIKYDNDVPRGESPRITEVSPDVGRVWGLESDASRKSHENGGIHSSETGSEESQNAEAKLASTTPPEPAKPVKLTGSVQEMVDQGLEDSGLDFAEAKKLVAEVNALGKEANDPVTQKLKEQRKALGNKRDEATTSAKAEIDAKIAERKAERKALRDKYGQIHGNVREVLATGWDGKSPIANQKPVGEEQLKPEAVEHLITDPKEKAVFDKVAEALKAGNSTRLEHQAEITGSTDAAASVTNAGNVKVPVSTFTPTHFSVTTKKVAGIRKEFVAVHGYNEAGHMSQYYINRSPEGSQILKVQKVLPNEAFTGATSNVELGPRQFKVADVLGRAPREEGVLTSEALEGAQDFAKLFTPEVMKKFSKHSQMFIKSVKKKGRFDEVTLKNLMKQLEKTPEDLAEVCNIFGLK